MVELIKFLVYSLLLFSSSAWAGRPFFTDDAALATSGTCQIETWAQFNGNDDRDLWIAPACNPAGNFEVTLGLNQLQINNDENVESYLLQGKTLFRELKANDWGLGLAFGVTRSRKDNADNDFVYLPLSVAFDDSLIVHANLGWLKDRTYQVNRTTWGIGTEYVLSKGTSVFTEVFGDDVIRPTIHTGFNFRLIPDRLNLNLTYGYNKALDRDNSFYSVGLNIYGLP